MDLGMPFATKEAWSKLKKLADQYAQVTGNEIALVTTYAPMHSSDGCQLDSFGNSKSTSIHGHGKLIRLVSEGLELVKNNNKNKTNGHSTDMNGFQESPQHTNGLAGSNHINIETSDRYGNGTHHDQSVARSLCSSYRSLRLGNDQGHDNKFNPYNQGWGGLNEEDETFYNSKPPSRQKKRSQRKSSSRSNQENLELDENLMFGEANEDSGNERNSSEDSDTDVSENSYDRPPTIFSTQGRTTRGFGPPPVNEPRNNANFAASLPVTINNNWGGRTEGQSQRFRDNQGPHPPLVYNPTKNKPQQQQPQKIVHAHQNSQDTPNPETMMASIQALARSVTDDTALIFGERPRPRLNTGETRRVTNRLR